MGHVGDRQMLVLCTSLFLNQVNGVSGWHLSDGAKYYVQVYKYENVCHSQLGRKLIGGTSSDKSGKAEDWRSELGQDTPPTLPRMNVSDGGTVWRTTGWMNNAIIVKHLEKCYINQYIIIKKI